ncbi:MAG TPA: acetate--CoA ligase family protein [Myxococcota bacterium]|nr:acetate--CoA ligase family protein [Myxococcota bacterium]HRY95720.1 acetate--CoA ligase family protein [Myxococcota bacterium]HSA21029.1 acetate--CoA ligase family protein [Myxococcota bacterium]
MRGFFDARSVVVVGVSDAPENMARSIVVNLQEFAFDGIIYQVGHRGGHAFGRRIFKSVADLPDQVDLAVILVPAKNVPGVLEECGQKGIRRAIVETAGFEEFGPEGKAVQDQVVAVARKHGIRFLGPNGIGVVNLRNGLVVPFPRLKDVFARGRVSILSQSGGVGLSYLNVLASENLGLSKFASLGNKLDVDECDLLEVLVDDPDTDIIVLYLEGISDGRRLMDIARRTAKPILVHKSNTGKLAREIAASHTASLSGDDAVVSAALAQVGMARFDDATTLVNYLKMLPLPRLRGDRLAIVSRSGGHAVIAADACEQQGFRLARFPDSFLREIERHFRASVIHLTNPLDLGDLFDFDVYLHILEETLKLPDVDGVVFLHTYIAALESERSRALFRRIEELGFKHGKPLAICVATDFEEMAILRRTLPHPVYTEPDDAIRSLKMVRDFRHHARPAPAAMPVGPDLARAQALFGRCRAEGRAPGLGEALEALRAAGLPVAESRPATSAEEAVAAAASLGGPVALKLDAAEASHKSDVGGVRLGCLGPEAVREGFAALVAAADRAGVRGAPRVEVQRMAPPGGRELILGARRDPSFGHVVLVGLGGVFVEVLRDVSMRVVPFDAAEVDEMLRSLKAYPVLTGIRGQAPRDLAALRQCVLALAGLVQACPEIAELDVNPLLLGAEGQGALAVDARIALAPASS